MSFVEPEYNEYELNTANDQDRPGRNATHAFLKGLIVGFGAAAVASAVFGLFSEQQRKRKNSMDPVQRMQARDESGGIVGDLSHVIDESTSAFNDAVKMLDRTFESGKQALESVQQVIDRIRE